MFEPLANANKNADGTLVFQVEQGDLGGVTEEAMRKQFERLNDQSNEVCEIGEEEEDEMRVSLLTEMEEAGISTEDFNEMLAKELNIFNGDEYSFTKDLREGFDAGVSTSTADKIFDTLPDHVFWDIKRPLKEDPESYWNKYNNARAPAGTSFFEMRSTERYFRSQKIKDNSLANISYYRKY